MQDHPLEGLQRLISAFPGDTGEAKPLDTATVLERTGVPSLRKLRPWIRACNAALASERWTVEDAVRERGTGQRRRWRAGAHCDEVYGACRRSILAEAAQQPDWRRTRAHADSTGHPYIMWVRALRLHDRTLVCPGGLPELEVRLDAEQHEPTGPTRQGEVHIHDVQWNSAAEPPEEPYTKVPEELTLNGIHTRGRGNTPAGLAELPECTELIRAQIATGIWMERKVACEYPDEELERVAAEEPDWDEWTPALDMPVHRHVESITTEDGLSWAPPTSLRFRANLKIYIDGGGDRGYLDTSRVRHHGETALQRVLDRAERYRDEITDIVYTGGPFETADLSRSIDPPPTPVPSPEQEAFHDPESGELELAGGPDTDIGEWAEACRDRGDIEAAMALLRQAVATMPSDLSALEDLSECHVLLGQRDEALGLKRELIARAEAMVPNKVRWQDSQLSWLQIHNRPFLRTLGWLASDHEDNGKQEEALTLYRHILAVCPQDNFGVRYPLIRLLQDARDWDGLRTLLRQLGADERGAAIDFARALLAWHDGGLEPFQEAVNRHPLIASRILQGDRPPTLSWNATAFAGSFGGAELYWTGYREAWTGSDAAKLRTMIQTARERSPRSRAIAGYGSAFQDPGKANEHMASYRRALMDLPGVDARHRDEFWDLTWRCENGSEQAKLAENGGTLEITWYGLVIELRGHWMASVRSIEEPKALPSRIHFEALDGAIRRSRERRMG